MVKQQLSSDMLDSNSVLVLEERRRPSTLDLWWLTVVACRSC